MNSRPSGFEERLKAALLARLPEAVPTPPARSFARRYGIPLAVGAATATVVAVMTLTGGNRTGSLPAARRAVRPRTRPRSRGSRTGRCGSIRPSRRSSRLWPTG